MNSYEYQVRIHSPTRRDDDIIAWLEKRGMAWFLAYERDANREHYQMYLQSRYKDTSLRRYIKEELNLQGNREYSLTELRKEPKDLVCYLMKEGDRVHAKIKSEIIVAAEAQQDEIQQTKAKPKAKFTSTVSQIMDTIKINDPTTGQIRVYVYAFFVKRRRLMPDPIQITKYVGTIDLYLRGGRAVIDRINEDLRYEDPSSITQAMDLAEQIFLFETE